MKSILLLAIVCVSLGSGCASITGGESQAMRITATEPTGDEVPGANCRLSNDKGAWTVLTPGEIQVRRSSNALSVTCERKPMLPGHASVPSLTRDAMYGNLLFGGIIGLAIDHSSGAGYEYSPHVNVAMGGFTTVAAAPPAPGRKPIAHASPGSLPEPSGHADYRDITALPSPKARAAYQEFLGKRFPRAFALGDDGGWFSSWGRSDTAARAVERCSARYKNCRLYAYDDVVVWRPADVTAVAVSDSGGAAARPAEPAATDTPLKRPASSADAAKPRPDHIFDTPQDSGFAKLADTFAMPFVDTAARERYVQRYLILRSPKAFAIGARGQWAYLANDPRSMKTVLERCNATNRGACWLYAVDDKVVWNEAVDKRVSIEMLKPLLESGKY